MHVFGPASFGVVVDWMVQAATAAAARAPVRSMKRVLSILIWKV